MEQNQPVEEKQVATQTREPRPLAKAGFAFLPQTWEQLYAYAKEISQTDFVPKAFAGKPGAVLACWQKGQEVGLPPMAALENIAIINGRPSIHSNGYWSLITSHPMCEWFIETAPDVALKQGYGECTIKRVGNPHPIVRRFTWDEAKTAGLIGKDNWKNYPGDMLQNRARHRAGDDAVPEAAQGLIPADVARDLPPRDITPDVEPLKIPQPIETTPAATTEQPEKPEQPIGKKAEALAWIKDAEDGDFLADGKSWLAKTIKGMTQADQLEVCRDFNERTKKLKNELEAASKSA